MKFVLCSKCSDVFKLSSEVRSCRCGLSQGRYLEDNLHAEINMAAIPIGLSNRSLLEAMRGYATNKSMDRKVDAWVFRVDEPHIERVEGFGDE